MNTTIHIKPHRLHLTTEQEKQLNAYTSSIKSPRITDNCFVPIIGINPSIESPQNIILTFSKQDVSFLNIVHSLAYYEKELSVGGTQSWENDDTITVIINKYMLHAIQYGFGCSVASAKRRSVYVDVPAFQWIIRAWCDEDTLVFRHGVKSLARLFLSKNGNVNIHEANARLIPTIFNRIGERKGQKGVWEDIFFKHFLDNDNPMIQALLAMIIVPGGSIRQNIHLSEAGYKRLSLCGGLPARMQCFLEKPNRNKHSKERKEYNFNSCHSVYFKWLVDSNFSGDQLILFLSFVYTRKNIVPKKMSKYVCDNSLLHSHTKLVARWMQDEYYGTYCNKRDVPRDGIDLFAKFISYVEMRGVCVMRSWSYEDWCRTEGEKRCFSLIKGLIEKDRHFVPIVQYPRWIVDKTDKKYTIHQNRKKRKREWYRSPHRNGKADQSFPILYFSKKIHGKIDEIVRDKLCNYFYNENSFSM